MGTARSPTTIRVFNASPTDVKPERETLAKVIDQINAVFAARRVRLRLQLRRWEDVCPGPGEPQTVINEEIGDYDVFIGLMWRRFGTPAGDAGGGTEQEYRLAYGKWQKSGQPHIIFYFSRTPAPPPRTVEEAQQLLSVTVFRAEISDKNLIAEYDGLIDFESKVWRHLNAVIAKLRPPRRRTANRVEPVSQHVQNTVVDEQVQRAQQTREVQEAMEKVRAVVSPPPPPESNGGGPVARSLSKDEVALVVELVTRALTEARAVVPTAWEEKP